MPNIKKYKVEHTPTGGEITVSIDFDFVNKIKNKDGGEEDYPIMDGIKEMVKFWYDWKPRFECNNEDYVNTFLKQLCSKVISMVADRNLTAHGVISELDGEEGWCPLNGSFGIELIEVTKPDMDYQDDFDIAEL